MNEDGTPVAADEPAAPVVDNINSEEGSVTADEVAQVLNIKAPAAQEISAEKPTEETPAEPEKPETPAEPVEQPKPEAPKAEPATPDTPAEVTSFALEIEDAEGNKITINPGDNLDEVLADFVPKNNGQIFQIVKDVMKMEQAKEAYDADQAKVAEKAEYDKRVADIQAGFDLEVERLQGEKRLPTVADGKENERLSAVYKFMTEENGKRIAAGQPPIQTIEDALDKLELREKREAEAEAARKAKEDARARGGLVGGSSAPAASTQSSHVPLSATNANQALKNAGLL